MTRKDVLIIAGQTVVIVIVAICFAYVLHLATL